MSNRDSFVVLQCADGVLHSTAWELVGAAQALRQSEHDRICGILLAENGWDESILRGLPADCVYVIPTDGLFDPQMCAAAITQCIKQFDPDILLLPGTSFGRAIAPRIAVACRTGLTADCTELERDENGYLVQIRPAFGGDIMARIVTEYSRPQMATIRTGVMERCEERNGYVPQIVLCAQAEQGALKLQKRDGLTAQTDSLTEKKILVAVGRGIRRKEDLEQISHLTELLGGTMACSRALVEQGFLPHDRQIGLSGASVRPDLLITFGISGSVQFMAGAGRAKKIVAVNSNPDARIFQFAHIPICGDLYEIIPEMIRMLEQKEE